jgi:hypothetical protein
VDWSFLRLQVFANFKLGAVLTWWYRIGLACFFTYMTIAEGGGKRALTQKFRDVYLPTLKANFVLWPAVQILNFRVIPIQFQIVSFSSALPELFVSLLYRASTDRRQPFVSCIGIAWTAYLSLTNSSEES